MILLDANILVYAWSKQDPSHLKAKDWVEAMFSSGQPIGVPWISIWAFLRITTNHRIYPNPLGPSEAHEIVSSWLGSSNVTIVHPGSRYHNILSQLMSEYNVTGPGVTDAALAALAIEYGATLASTDRDLRRFANLTWINPLSTN